MDNVLNFSGVGLESIVMQKDTPPVSVENCRILLVENDEADALRLGGLLGECKGDSHRRFEVTARVGQLQEVLTFLMTGAVDLILLDLGLPGAAGVDGCWAAGSTTTGAGCWSTWSTTTGAGCRAA